MRFQDGSAGSASPLMSEVERRRIEAALARSSAARDADQPDEGAFSWDLRVGNRRFSRDRRVRRLERVDDDSAGVAVALHSTIAGRLPPELEYEEVTLDVKVAGRRIRRFRGEAEEPLKQGTSTALSAHTAGWWLDKIKLRSYYTILDKRPHDAARELLFRAPYNKAFARIEQVASPKVRVGVTSTGAAAAGEAGWPEFASPADPMQALSAQVGYVWRDIGLNGPTARVPTAYPGEAEWEFELGPGELVEAPAQREYDGKWRSVVIFRTDDRGRVNKLTLPMAVPGSRAQEDAILYIEVTDNTAAAEVAALQRCRDEVEKMTGWRRRGEWSRRGINPFLDRGSSVVLTHRDWDDDGFYSRRWAAELTGVRDDYIADKQDFAGEMVLLSETRLPPPRPTTRGRTFASFAARPLMGGDSLGRFYLEDSLPFVTVLTEGTVEIDAVVASQMGVGVRLYPELNQVILDNAPLGSVMAGDERTIEELGGYTIEEMS